MRGKEALIIDGPAKREVWLGLDLGTQSVRAIAVSDTGAVLGQGSHPVTSQRNGSRHEQQPEEWWQAVIAACHQAIRGMPANAIRGIAVDSTSGTILLADHRGNPITPALMYDDTRAAAEIERVNTVGADMWSTLGYRMQPSWALPKLLWLLHEYPQLPSGTKLLHQGDFINWRLTGHEAPTDTSTALKTGCDLLHDSWPRDIFAQLGVPEDILPAVVRSGTRIGEVGTEAANETGIPQGTPVIAGMTDGCAAQIGAGALSVGSWNSVLGTTLVLKGVTRELLHDPAGIIYSHRSPDGTWLPGGASSTGAGALASYFPGRSLAELNERAAEREPASVVVYPLISRGERFPFTAPEAEGFVLGTPGDEIDFYAGLLQGIAFIERLCFDYLDMLGAPTSGDIRLTGGGTRSRYWNQLRADVLGRTVSIPENAEAVLGMAILAASAGYQVADVANRMVHISEKIDPRPGQHERFGEPYIRLVNELERRGWIAADVATHARRRAER